MSEGMMHGMVLGGILLSATAILLSAGIAVYLVRRHRARGPVPGRDAERADDDAARERRRFAAGDG